MAGVMHKCDRRVDQYDYPLRLAAKELKEISQIDTDVWDFAKLATALMIICNPKPIIQAAQQVNYTTAVQINCLNCLDMHVSRHVFF
jgi:hypothetical protein